VTSTLAQPDSHFWPASPGSVYSEPVLEYVGMVKFTGPSLRNPSSTAGPERKVSSTLMSTSNGQPPASGTLGLGA
jgi:hypothetical protein